MSSQETIALIPARSGSKRVPGKNTRILAGHPLLAYSIAAAQESGVVDRTIVSTDDSVTQEIALSYGADCPELRPSHLSGDSADDYSWVSHALETWVPRAPNQVIVVLRPTSPLRRGASIVTARELLVDTEWADSARSLKRVSEHPGKMWRLGPEGEATTYLDQGGAYNGPTQALEELWVQSSSLEVVWRDSIDRHRSIAGSRVRGFELPGEESRDINSEWDWTLLESLVMEKPELLPQPVRVL